VKTDIAIFGAFHSVTLARRADSATLAFGGVDHRCALQEVAPGEYRLAVDGKTHRVWVAVHRGYAYIHAFGRAWDLEVVDPVARAQRSAGGGDAVATAPMPGTVVKIMVVEGDAVRKGQPLLIIESMKMQTEIVARRDGTVERVFVAENQTFDRGARLIALTAEE
jgi:biotin carboxyl carrier protein